MPNDPGPSSWLGGQYQKMLEGIEQVGTGQATRIRRSQARVIVDAPKQPTINVPAWGDIVRTGPRVELTDEDWQIQRHFERAKLPSPLTREKQDEIARRRAAAERIRNSAIPEYQQGVSAIVTAIDNVQDAALTASVATRVTLPALGRFGAWLAPAVLALGQIARLLNWLNLGAIYFGILYAVACKGPREGLAQGAIAPMAAGVFKGIRALLPRGRGIPTPTPGQWQKGRMAAMMYGTQEGRALTDMRGSRWANSRVSFGEALQVAQTTSDLTGYGISLGAIMGFIGETTYAAQRALAGERIRVRSPQVNHAFRRAILPRVGELAASGAWHREQCCRALASAPLILRDPETFGDELYVLTWLTVYVSLEPLMWDTEGIRWRDTVITGLPAAWTAWDVRDIGTRGTLHELGIDPDAPARWPIAGAPFELEAERIVRELGPAVARALDRWLAAAPEQPARRFISELSMRVLDRVMYWLEGTAHFPRYELAPPTAVWESLWQADRWPIVSDPPDKLVSAWLASERYVRETGHKYIDPPELDRIWSEAGTPLLHMRQDDYALPVEHFAPYDTATGIPGDAAVGDTVAEAREKLRRFREQRGP